MKHAVTRLGGMTTAPSTPPTTTTQTDMDMTRPLANTERIDITATRIDGDTAI